MNRLKSRDPASIAAEYRANLPALKAAAARLGFHAADAEDLIHTVWMTFLDVVPRFEGRSQVRTFLLGVMRRHASRARRRAGRLTPSDPTLLDRPLISPDPVESGELSRALHACVGELRKAERQVVELQLLEQRETEEVRHLLGISKNYVGVLLHRARAHLKHCLAEHMPSLQPGVR